MTKEKKEINLSQLKNAPDVKQKVIDLKSSAENALFLTLQKAYSFDDNGQLKGVDFYYKDIRNNSFTQVHEKDNNQSASFTFGDNAILVSHDGKTFIFDVTLEKQIDKLTVEGEKTDLDAVFYSGLSTLVIVGIIVAILFVIAVVAVIVLKFTPVGSYFGFNKKDGKEEEEALQPDAEGKLVD